MVRCSWFLLLENLANSGRRRSHKRSQEHTLAYRITTNNLLLILTQILDVDDADPLT
jgi:hypothetical protein